MIYKGYIGETEYDEDAKIFTGIVVNVKTVITFQSASINNLEKEFHASIDDYLEWCKKDGIKPEIEET